MEETEKLLKLATAVRTLKDQVTELSAKAVEIQKLEGPQGPKGDKGDKGDPGKDGKDGLNGIDGKDGKDGKDGIDGADGNSIKTAFVDIDGGLTIEFTDGSTLDAGEVVGQRGPMGPQGPKGDAGQDGATGVGVAPGGTTGQVLSKASNTDYDTVWVTPSSSGGGGGITVETDPIYTASTWYSTTNNSSNWNTAYGWGNHASAGYLTSGSIGTTVQAYDANTAKYTDSLAHFLGNLEVDGNIQIDGNLVVSGTTTTVTAQNLALSDNMIYLNNAIQTTITNAVGNGTSVTYTTSVAHNYLVNMSVTVTGVNPSSFNVSNATITAVTSNTFTIASTVTATYVSGGTARAKTNANPDIGIAAGYNDGTYHHTGFFRDASDNRWKVFKNYTLEPDASVFIDTSHSSFELSEIQAANFYGNLVGNADTVTNGLYSTGSYANPAWLTSIAGSKVTGDINGNAANITGTYSGTLTSGQVTTALGYTPYDATNPNGYTSNAGTVTSVSGTGSVSGITLSGTVTSSGNLTLGGTLSATSSNISDFNSAVDGRISSAVGVTVQAYDADLTSWAGVAPSTKQNTLVSGTNIKTINSNSVLGAGNIAVQDTLVSGTNIKTINGSSVLGSGNLVVAGALAESTSVFTTGSAQTYTAPANTQWVKVTVVGPGGNGGAATNQRATGGGGGAVAIKWLAMNAGQTLTYTVGTASGTASTVSSGTLVITTISAGSGSNGAGTAYAASITAGAAGGTATGGDINITGGQGGHSYGSGTTVTTNFSGKGGDCPGFGSGGSALGLVATAGVQGNGYGAGGGGAHGSNSAASGRGGIIIFEAY